MGVGVAVVCLVLCMGSVLGQGGNLYPRDSESRQTKSLDGIWNFRSESKGDRDLGLTQRWYSKPLSEFGPVEMMPVPSSYQDLSQERERRDHIGWVWYDREFWVPSEWNSVDRRVFLRFGSVHYRATVWINGVQVIENEGGHLPFQVELVPTSLNFDTGNRITVAVNNTLTPTTLPQGFIKERSGEGYPPGHVVMEDNFDFFNYAGIHRSVVMYTTPRNFIEDIRVTPGVVGTTGSVQYAVSVVGTGNVGIELVDKQGTVVGSGSSAAGTLQVVNAKLWWPYTMVKNASDAGYLYTLKVTLEGPTKDVYRLKVGIRSVKWTTTSFLINDKPFYFTGFGRHEDFYIHGRGFDPVLLIKDHNLIKWTGANSYRTTHYPYSEELMDVVDELGIVVIDEISAVSLTEFTAGLLATHKLQMTRLIQRDKNRASVVMWSVANEPRSRDPNSENYFREIFALTKSLDSTRPVMVVVDTNYAEDKAAQFADVIGLNRYHAWYTNEGQVEVVQTQVRAETYHWMNTFKRPLIFTEYGADTIAGLHYSPSWIFTEEFQEEYMREHFKVFDEMRMDGSVSFIGEMIWNFADFMTSQEIRRVVGNRKGIFTRDRQPKSSAHLLRTRYHLLAFEQFGYPVPNDLHQSTPVYLPPGKDDSASNNICLVK